MMKKFFVGLFSLLMGVGSAFAQTNMSSEMYDLAKMKEGLRNRPRFFQIDVGGSDNLLLPCADLLH